MTNEHISPASDNLQGTERDDICAEFGAECADLRSEIILAQGTPESNEVFSQNLAYIQPFIENEVDASFPGVPSPREAAALLKPETAQMTADMFKYLEAAGYPRWLIDQAVTITSTVRSTEYTNHIYDGYIEEAEAAGDERAAARWRNIKARLASGAQVSHTTGRKIDIVVSNGKLNSLSEWFNEEGIFKSVGSFFKSGKAGNFKADFHAGHYDVVPTTRDAGDIPYRTNADITGAIQARDGASEVREAGSVDTGIVTASVMEPFVAANVNDEPAAVLDTGEVNPEPVLLDGLNLRESIKVNSAVVQTRLNLRNLDDPNVVSQKATANQEYECVQPPVVKTGRELGITDEALADYKFVCIKAPKGEAWAWSGAFKQDRPSQVA